MSLTGKRPALNMAALEPECGQSGEIAEGAIGCEQGGTETVDKAVESICGWAVLPK